MNNEQKIDKTGNDLLNIKDDETDLDKDIQLSGEDMPEDKTMDLTDGMIITPSFYNKNKTSVEDKIDSPEKNSDNFNLAEDEESVIDLDTQSFLDNENPVDLDAQTIADSKDNLNSSDFLTFTDNENTQDSELPFDAKTVFAPGGDLSAIELDASDKIKQTDIDDNEPVFELGKEISDKEHAPEENQTIDLNAETIAHIESNTDISENEKSGIDEIDDLFSDFDTKTIIAPNGDLDSLDFNDPVEEAFDINAETVVYSESDIDEISEIRSETENTTDKNLFSEMDSETIIEIPDDNEPLDLDDILDASDDVNPGFIDATTINISGQNLSQDSEDFSEEISDSEKTIALDPETFVEETDNDEESSVRDLTTMDGRDSEDAVISLEEATVLDLEEDAVIDNDDMVLELDAEAVIEPVEHLIPDSEEIQDIDFKQAAETIALAPDTDEDDILDLDISQNIEDQPENDIPILTSEDRADADHEPEEQKQLNDGYTALDLIESLGGPDESPEIEEPEDFIDALDSATDLFPQDEDDLSMILNKSMETIEEPVESSDIQEPESENILEAEDNLPKESIQNIDELTTTISSAQIEASLERVINKIFSERIEKILITVVEKAVSEEISKFRASLMEDLADEDNF